MANTIQVKRGNNASLPTLSDGELGWSNDTYQLHIGDGTSNHEIIVEDFFDANTILKADSDNSPTTLTVSEGNIVARKSGGNITGLGGSDILDMLSGTATSGFSMNSQKITDVTDPSSAQDAATKNYVDSVEQGLDPKDSVRVTTDGTNIDLTATSDPGAIDGVTLSDGDRILLKDQSTATENGIYIASTATNPSTWSRATDADEDSEVTAGLYTWVEEGTNNGDKGFLITTDDPITLGSTSITFSQFSGAGQITAGTNLTKSGDTLNVSPQGADSGLNADQLDGVELANITWSDVSMAQSDVSSSDVGLGNVTNDAQIAKDGSIAFTGSQSMGLNDLTNINAFVMDEIATPSNPSSGFNKLYFKSDDHLYALDDAGNETQIDSAGADELVAVDASATADYIGNASNDGVLRTGSSKLTYSDGGDYVTLDVDPAQINFDGLGDVASITEAQGQILFNSSTNNWDALSPGTSGQLLQTGGGGADPSWVSFTNYTENSPTSGENNKAPDSAWAYSHETSTTGIHGAGANDLLHSGSTIDGGAF